MSLNSYFWNKLYTNQYFFTPTQMVFHWSLSDSKCPPVVRTLHMILTDLPNIIFKMILIRLPISNSCRSLFKLIRTAPRALITTVITDIIMSHTFLSSRAIIIITIIIDSFRVFHISISWWFFTGVWVTANLLKSPGLVSVFWPSSAMLSFG